MTLIIDSSSLELIQTVAAVIGASGTIGCLIMAYLNHTKK